MSMNIDMSVESSFGEVSPRQVGDKKIFLDNNTSTNNIAFSKESVTSNHSESLYKEVACDLKISASSGPKMSQVMNKVNAADQASKVVSNGEVSPRQVGDKTSSVVSVGFPTDIAKESQVGLPTSSASVGVKTTETQVGVPTKENKKKNRRSELWKEYKLKIKKEDRKLEWKTASVSKLEEALQMAAAVDGFQVLPAEQDEVKNVCYVFKPFPNPSKKWHFQINKFISEGKNSEFLKDVFLLNIRNAGDEKKKQQWKRRLESFQVPEQVGGGNKKKDDKKKDEKKRLPVLSLGEASKKSKEKKMRALKKKQEEQVSKKNLTILDILTEEEKQEKELKKGKTFVPKRGRKPGAHGLFGKPHVAEPEHVYKLRRKPVQPKPVTEPARRRPESIWNRGPGIEIKWDSPPPQEDEEKERDQTSKMKHIFSSDTKHKEEIEINITDRYTEENFIQDLRTYGMDSSPDFFVVVEIGGKSYPMNTKFIEKLFKILKGELGGDQLLTVSDQEVLRTIREIKNIKFIVYKLKNKTRKRNNKRRGAFFPFVNKTLLNLENQQILDEAGHEELHKPEEKKKKNEELENWKFEQRLHCLVFAVMKHKELVDSTLEIPKGAISLMVGNNKFPMGKLDLLAGYLKRQIKLTHKKNKIEERTRTTTYGDGFIGNGPALEIGLLENHYFLNESLDCSPLAIENYELVLERYPEDWNRRYKIQDGRRFKKSKAALKSSAFKIISSMLKNKKDCLRAFTFRDIIQTTESTTGYKIEDLEVMEKDVKEYQDWVNKKYTKKKGKYVLIEKGKPEVEVTFDFETITSGKKHVPYLCCYHVRSEKKTKTFTGEECGKEMLEDLEEAYPETHIMMIAHNASYDLRFIAEHLQWNSDGLLTRANRLISGKCFYKSLQITLHDSFRKIPAALSTFGKMFQLKQEKEVMPYSAITPNIFINEWMELEDLKKCDELQVEARWKLFLHNAEKWNCVKDGKVCMMRYSAKYCALDCEVLAEGLEVFNQAISQLTKEKVVGETPTEPEFSPELDIQDFVSCSSIANNYLKSQDCFEDVFSFSAVCRDFISKTVVGGRVMCANNRKAHVTKKLNDFDAVSLYPSAIVRLGGFLKGKPKVIPEHWKFLDLQTRKNNDEIQAYFVEIEVLDIPKKRDFPILSKVEEDGPKKGTRMFSNNLRGQLWVTWMELEDAIKYQNLQFKLIRGYYFDEGRCENSVAVTKNLFEMRLKYKKEKNPVQQVIKLILNSLYGTTITKASEEKTEVVSGEEELDVYLRDNCGRVNSFTEIGESKQYILETAKDTLDHYNMPHVGAEILGMSKRIMNEVICLGEDMGMKIYYQDTDSMHIEDSNIKPLAARYEEIYGRKLIGKKLGQFHCDFDDTISKKEIWNPVTNKIETVTKTAKEVWAKESIFLGKKCYLDVLTLLDEDGKEHTGYHIRMKGVGTQDILDWASDHGITPRDVYEKLYKGEAITFVQKKIRFVLEKDLSVRTWTDTDGNQSNPSRTIQFL